MYPFLEAVVCLLALYGLIIIVRAIFERRQGDGSSASFAKKGCPGNTPSLPTVRVVLLVRNAEEQIEFIIRNAMKYDITSKVLSDNRLIAVDMDSSDNTYVLLEKLQSDFSGLEVLKSEDIPLVFNKMK